MLFVHNNLMSYQLHNQILFTDNHKTAFPPHLFSCMSLPHLSSVPTFLSPSSLFFHLQCFKYSHTNPFSMKAFIHFSFIHFFFISFHWSLFSILFPSCSNPLSPSPPHIHSPMLALNFPYLSVLPYYFSTLPSSYS